MYSFPASVLLPFHLTIIFILSSSTSFSQSPSFKKLSCPEKRWVFLHPFAAKKAFRITVESRAVSKQMETDSLLDHDPDGGQVDAFRHAYWMSRLAQEMCWRKVRRLGRAHERGNYLDFKKHRTGEEIFSDSIASAMDLFNNDVGLDVGRKNKSSSKEEMKNQIIKKILAGEMKIILKDRNGNSLDCEKKIIDMKLYSGIWNIPRCLIKSNEATR
jgi:hypothetical protein